LTSTLGDSRFFQALLAIDKANAEKTQSLGCPFCGGVLDVANYPRKPRGFAETGEPVMRLSFCCRRQGCRKRTMPESVRFLGRKVYSGLVVVLAAFESAVQVALGLCRQTLSRWRVYWSEVLRLSSPFWKGRRALFPPGFEAHGSPEALVRFFEERSPAAHEAATTALRFFSPLSLSRAA
jgi:hypothetical protein